MELAIIISLISIAILVRIILRVSDRNRIQKYIQQRGGRVISITWAPFGKGWLGKRKNRIYQVTYYDANQEKHAAYCKVGLFSGVYWAEDNIKPMQSKAKFYFF